ncbi:MAG: DUF2075 domain-containing protein [Ignavibacteriaceae bacterium]
MNRSFYSDTITNFLNSSIEEIIGKISLGNDFGLEQTQRAAWLKEISILKNVLYNFTGKIYFEYSIPRLGQRIDVLVIIQSVIFVLEFKAGEKKYSSYAIDQVTDYALELKNFHETSHNKFIVPILIATEAKDTLSILDFTVQEDKILSPIKVNTKTLIEAIDKVLIFLDSENINIEQWELGRYQPTPTIVEAAMALYNNHSVEDITRSDASAINLSQTSDTISEIIQFSKNNSRKSICFVTGVPGAGKTLVGLNIATKHIDKTNDLYSVFLSGNGPLVAILREALTRDKVLREKSVGRKITKGEVLSEVKMFIQNVHNFRDEYLKDEGAPLEHVALFDEAQRAWNIEQTSNFMRRKKGKQDFNQSEPEFLISCLNRHNDWAVIVCLVGGGQEINTGEAGISEWINSLNKVFTNWDIYISPKLSDSEYDAENIIDNLKSRMNVKYKDALHLSVSMRSFRAENVSLLIKQMLDLNIANAQEIYKKIKKNYPIVITRDVKKAKLWLKSKARGSERYGIVVSSQAERLKPQSIFVKSPMNPIHWFLNGKEDTRSSYYLEDVATEFHVQGLELDWVCVTWDADFRYSNNSWQHWSFRGNRWQRIKKPIRQNYLKNAYRVLLTRARQGMIIVVPEGNTDDHTRPPTFYDPTFEYLKEIGFEEI